MPKLIKQDSGSYTNVSNQLVRDSKLSWKARGIFTYLWSQSNNWQFYVNEIATHATDGVKSLKSGLKELEERGYLKRVNRIKAEGGFDGMDWILSDRPECQYQNGVNAKKDENTPKNVQNVSDTKKVRHEKGQTQNGTLRNNNNKNYQYEELTKERNNIYSLPDKQDEPHAPKPPKSKSDEQDYSQIYKDVIDYLNKKTGAHYKPSSKVNQRLIKSRAKEGYSLDDFKRVIDNKSFSWQNTDMWKYMRPSTIFGSKFDDYLNENDLKQHQTQPTSGGYNTNVSFTDMPDDDDLPF